MKRKSRPGCVFLFLVSVLVSVCPRLANCQEGNVAGVDATTMITRTKRGHSFQQASESFGYMDRQADCFGFAKPMTATGDRAFYMMAAEDGGYSTTDEVRSYASTCYRSSPYNHEKLLNESLTASDYLKALQLESLTLIESYNQQSNDLRRGNADGSLSIQSIDDSSSPPVLLTGRGNFFFASIHQMEHTVEQLEYLVGKGKLPHEFQDLAMRYKFVIIPKVAEGLYPGCVYISKTRMSEQCGQDVREGYYMLDEWMLDEISGTHNKILHQPTQAERSHKHPFSLNPNLDFNKIERAFLDGDVLAIDNFLTETGLQQLRQTALESTVFFDAKKGYLGAYADDGLTSPWMKYLVRELQERLPNILGGMPLRQAWVYKYDSDNSMRGIGIHADQAAVNLNVWLTPDDANLNKDSGGLVVYNILPPEEDIFGSTEKFSEWNNFEKADEMRAFLKEKGTKSATVPYKQNRCVMFNSALLHETDDFTFRDGYENRRINLTLLFGAKVKEGTTLLCDSFVRHFSHLFLDFGVGSIL